MSARRIVLVVPDLFFATRIAAAAKHAGVELVQATAESAAEACRERPTDLAIVDLDGHHDAGALVGALKRGAPGVRVVAFCRHTATARIQAARAAGADQVLPRSAFFPNLHEILGRGGINTPTEAP